MTSAGKWILGIIVLIVVVVLLAVIANNGSKVATDDGPIKIGFVGPLTGEAAAYGEPARNITQIAVEEINAEGGINGRMLEVIYEDAACSGQKAVSAANKLINVDKVKYITGLICSTEALAAVPLGETAKVLMVSQAASSPDLTGKSLYFVRTNPSDATQGRVLAELAWAKGWKKVAFLQEQLDYPLGIYNAFSKTFLELGGTITREEFATSVTDVRSLLTKLRSENPDALFIDTQTPASAERAIKQLADLNWEIQILLTDAGLGDRDMVGRNATALEGAVGAEFGVDPTNPKFANLAKVYMEKYGLELPYQQYAQTEYDAVYMIRDAIALVGNDTEAAARWFRDVENWMGASGVVEIGEDGDRTGGHIPKIVKSGDVVSLADQTLQEENESME
ncbi:MAG: hypothetical protein COV07_01070 [Candidatus Vogelbacteria bacterium CG10_big_fil_rev_8_21_14_0_10_45_14]|uniref:Leucine-binding protein domain-containing protein n=1 Tax=Candidatus Vogelbacteria bacterium CG10_big_fil_rev_8_21_14_0_10_45_14 TaxID=1975042 RepID=A0A2H0RKM8_9BACT|nr:MAG: hypothetical protein COV07_01070 [Candidatus Vogelbacteria bacterium CG10_big_fil_rev_8_21_14_0_10_45_14]